MAEKYKHLQVPLKQTFGTPRLCGFPRRGTHCIFHHVLLQLVCVPQLLVVKSLKHQLHCLHLTHYWNLISGRSQPVSFCEWIFGKYLDLELEEPLEVICPV